MEDKDFLKTAGSQMLPEQKINKNSDTIELQDFFSRLLPNPEETSENHELAENDFLTQLLASTISQEIDLFHQKEQSINNNSSNQALQASSLVGRSVLTENNQFYLDQDGTVTGRLKLPNLVHHVLVYVENEQKEIVRIIPLGDDLVNNVSFIWNGVNRKGERAPEGEYKFIVSAICASKVIELKTYTYNKVIRASFSGADVVHLYFENDRVLNLNDVAEILND